MTEVIILISEIKNDSLWSPTYMYMWLIQKQKNNVLIVLPVFYMMSLKFKLQNYWSSWYFTLMMYKNSWKLISVHRVFIKHRRSDNPPATTCNFPDKIISLACRSLKLNFALSGQILLLFCNILLLLQFLMKTMRTNFCSK